MSDIVEQLDQRAYPDILVSLVSRAPLVPLEFQDTSVWLEEPGLADQQDGQGRPDQLESLGTLGSLVSKGNKETMELEVLREVTALMVVPGTQGPLVLRGLKGHQAEWTVSTIDSKSIRYTFDYNKCLFLFQTFITRS